jgi:hypothetical protein
LLKLYAFVWITHRRQQKSHYRVVILFSRYHEKVFVVKNVIELGQQCSPKKGHCLLFFFAFCQGCFLCADDEAGDRRFFCSFVLILLLLLEIGLAIEFEEENQFSKIYFC